MAAKMVRIVNNTNAPIGIEMADGDYIHLTQQIRGKDSHISKPVEDINLPEPVTKKQAMAARGMVSLIPA